MEKSFKLEILNFLIVLFFVFGFQSLTFSDSYKNINNEICGSEGEQKKSINKCFECCFSDRDLLNNNLTLDLIKSFLSTNVAYKFSDVKKYRIEQRSNSPPTLILL
jgi:hypothetical protein